MAHEPGKSPGTAEGPDVDVGPLGYTMFSIPEEKTMAKLYGTLKPEQRTWRCEQMKKSADLMEKSLELLRPIAEGRWDKEKAYTGLALLLKAIYEGQGYATLRCDMVGQLGELMRIVQEHLPTVTANGRRMQADDSPARFALRVAFTCITMTGITGMSHLAAGRRDSLATSAEELQAKALQMAVRCMDKLGGPLSHEGTLTAEEKGHIARLATSSEPDVERLISGMPLHVLALYMLQVQYDIELRVVKWVLHYVAARCAKEAYSRLRGEAGAAASSTGTAAAQAAWVSHSAALGKLEPGSPLAAFMVAEAKTAEGAKPDTLALMRAAAAAAERRGDDLVAWLARLNAIQLMVHGACGATFSEDEVMQEFDAAATHKASASRWGGAVLQDGRSRTLKKSLKKALQQAREVRQKQLAEAAAGANEPPDSAAAATAAANDGRLPSIFVGGDQFSVMTPVVVPLRECAGCKKMFHKAMACAKCKQMWYCGKDCQAAHWKAGHKNECAALANAAARAAAAAPEDDDDDN